MKIFCDDGSTAIKLAWFDDNDELQTLVSTNAFKREWLVDLGVNDVYNYTVGQQRYSYDKTSPVIKTTTNIDYQYSDYNLIAVHHALLRSGIAPQEIELTVTLPITEFFKPDNTFNTDNIERKKQNLLRQITSNDRDVFTFKSISVMPESIPTIVTYLKDHNLHELETTLVIDLGGTTLDCALITGNYDSISEVSGDSTIGVNIVTDGIIEFLKSINRQSNALVANEILKLINDDDFLIRIVRDKAAVKALRANIAEHSQNLANLVIDHIQRFKAVDRVVLTGGGAKVIAPFIKDHFSDLADNVFTFENSQIALVIAMAEIEKE